MEDTRGLAKRLRPSQHRLSRHQGVVESVGTGNVSITLDGGTAVVPNVKYLDSYTPTVGDIVEIMMDDTDIIILGKLA